MVDFENSPMFDGREKAALRFALLFKSGDDAIDSDAVYEDLKRQFSEEEIIELALLCAETDGVGKMPDPCRCARGMKLAQLNPRFVLTRKSREPRRPRHD
jgi:hypothetical protein